MKVGGKYQTLLKTKTKRGGRYAVRVPPTWKYRVLFPGTFGLLGSTSKTR